MWKTTLSILLFAVVPVFGQFPSHTVTVQATRSVNLQPDQVVFGVSVSSSTGTNLNQVVAALAGVGITAADLTGVGNSDPSTFDWGFTLAVPIASLTATSASLTSLEQTIGQNNSGLALTFSVNGTQVSQQLQASQTCSNADLIADATAQGQTLASAAGMTLGPILKLSNVPATPSAVGATLGFFPTLVLGGRLGSFSGAPVGYGFPVQYVASPVTCSLFVQFQLLP
jgi:hypothetical protein